MPKGRCPRPSTSGSRPWWSGCSTGEGQLRAAVASGAARCIMPSSAVSGVEANDAYMGLFACCCVGRPVKALRTWA